MLEKGEPLFQVQALLYKLNYTHDLRHVLKTASNHSQIFKKTPNKVNPKTTNYVLMLK
jgi:hypothetical protein